MPDWDKPFGVTTPRVNTREPKQADGYPADDKPPPHTTEDVGKRVESAGGPVIWRAYEEGY